MHIASQLSSQLDQLRQQHRYRTLTQRQSSHEQFGNNDYLGYLYTQKLKLRMPKAFNNLALAAVLRR